jgi:hypothetical protein
VTRIVGVHGVGNYRPSIPPQQVAEHLRTTWTRHLTGSPTNSPSGVDLCIAYYAPYLHPPGQQGTPDDPTDLDPMAQSMALTWIAQLGLPQEVAQGPGTAPLRQAISWVAEHFGCRLRPRHPLRLRLLRRGAHLLAQHRRGI